MYTDPIADMLTRIRNAITARHEAVDVPASKIKKAIGEILVSEGYIKSCDLVEDSAQGTLKIALKPEIKNTRVLTNLKRVSKPGLRVYCGYQDLPKVLNGLGIAIISTSKGIMSDREARKQKVGGEVLAYVW